MSKYKILKGHSNDLTSHFHDVWRLETDRLKRSDKKEAAEAEIFWLLVPSVGKAPKTLDPTIPTMQPSSIFLLAHYVRFGDIKDLSPSQNWDNSNDIIGATEDILHYTVYTGGVVSHMTNKQHVEYWCATSG